MAAGTKQKGREQASRDKTTLAMGSFLRVAALKWLDGSSGHGLAGTGRVLLRYLRGRCGSVLGDVTD
ncbi:uncharacterized protein GLRG_04276 [Colletotrichum graminicola M1.001]|uniref:Uncharacterized protein n=1 Tax=Colletotrichum graminicola (strain M1.001 / M2 / FGSC 10212) TaxID=645133 RepID=E3QE44_COLGM|nr:uncharacterized protein GLRG_04276 [Colletotrichum graminicola M1.001]EFQ29132.1 hypothetical protein GLRG_04276 [Colletotrichum graminicola M1.001]